MPILLGTLVLLLVGLWDVIVITWKRAGYCAVEGNASVRLAVAAGLTLGQAGLIACFLTILAPPWRLWAAAGVALAALTWMLLPPAGTPGSAVGYFMTLVLILLTMSGLLGLRCLGYRAQSLRDPRIQGRPIRFRIWDLLVVTTGVALLLAFVSGRAWSTGKGSVAIVALAMAAGLALISIAAFGTLLRRRFSSLHGILLLSPCIGTVCLAAVVERSCDVSLDWTVLAATYTGVVIGVVAVARTAGLRFSAYLPRNVEKGLGRSIAKVIENRS